VDRRTRRGQRRGGISRVGGGDWRRLWPRPTIPRSAMKPAGDGPSRRAG